MASPKKVIEEIRRIRFGIGLDTANLSDEQKASLKDKEKILKDAARLAREINTKKPYFVFELIQNAEDNNYKKSVKPKFKFIVKSNYIIIQNNEKGFNKKDVWDLCSVGSSRKTKALGYIGEKGIGFKSVFLVSSEPHICSNNFQFKFKYKENNPASIIIPEWISDIPDFVDGSQTNIILPIKSKERKEIKNYIEKIHPSLLLFLRKLKIIEVEDEIRHKYKRIEKHKWNGKVQIVYGKKKSYWKIVKKLIKVPDHIKEERRKDIHETEIVLAFPLNEDGFPNVSDEQFVFAFLPVCKYGFKFIIQSDFLLPIGREDIIRDNEWNKWLRNSVTVTFLDAVNKFKIDEKLKYTFYAYLSLEEVKNDFFLPIVEQIYKNLQDSDCILTETNEWRKPSDVLVGDEKIKRLVSNHDLQNLFGKEYLSADIKVKKSILQKLGVNEFSIENLIECLQNTEWVEKQNDDWFALLYDYISEQKLSEEIQDEIKKLDIIRLENGELTSINKGTIFFPLNKKGMNYGFESELRVVKRNIIGISSKHKKQKETSEFLKELGIQSPDPYRIVENHILPIYENEEWKLKESDILLGYVRYIEDNINVYEKESDKRLNGDKASWQTKEGPLKRIRKSLFIRIKKAHKREKWYNKPENIYLPKIYGNENELEFLFAGIEVSFIHPCYIKDILKESKEKRKYLKSKLKGKSKKWKNEHKKKVNKIKVQIKKIKAEKNKKIEEWREFFLKIGIKGGLRVIKTNDSYLSSEGEKKLRKNNTSYSSSHDASWDYTSQQIIDYTLEFLDKFLSSLNKSKTFLLIKLLEKQWKFLSKYKELRYEWRYYRWYSASADSTWLHLLKTTAWLQTSLNTLEKPSEIFLDKPEIQEVLGDTIPYLAVKIKNEDFIKALCINTEANVAGVLNYLKALTEQKCTEKSKFEKLYKFLNKNFEDNEEVIKEYFFTNPLIYIPNTEKIFFTSNSVLWKDVSQIFGENRAYLEGYYPQLKYFFVEKLVISEKPSPKDYAGVLTELSKKDEIIEEDEKIILRIYEELNNHLNPENVETLISEEDWWDDFISKPIYFIEAREFHKNKKDIFINDNQELYTLFKDKEDIEFLWLPIGYHPEKIKFFIESTGIRYLSKAVKVTPSFGVSPRSKYMELTKRLHNFMSYIIRYLYWKENTIYENLKKEDLFEKIINLVAYTVDDLKVEYFLQIHAYKSVITDATRPCLLYENKLYISKESLKNMDYIGIELSKLFGKIKGLDDFIISVFEKQTKEKIENLMNAKGIQKLPETEEGPIEKFSQITKIEKPTLKQKEMTIVHEEEITETLHQESISPPLSKEKIDESIKHKEPWHPECPVEEADVNIREYKPSNVTLPSLSYEDREKKMFTYNKKPSSFSSESKDSSILSEDDKKAIGIEGEKDALMGLKKEISERYPYEKIKDTYEGFVIEKNEKLLVKITWLNKNGEKGIGYDIELIENDTKYFIEIKSTKTEEKDWFDLSKTQWGLMKKEGDKFWIYRVYGAGSKNPEIVKIKNPYKLWKEGDIVAHPVRIQI